MYHQLRDLSGEALFLAEPRNGFAPGDTVENFDGVCDDSVGAFGRFPFTCRSMKVVSRRPLEDSHERSADHKKAVHLVDG